MKDGSHSNVKCITDVNLSINEYDYLFLWRGKMRGVYPILTLTLNSQHEVVISNGAVQNGIRNVLLAKGITAIKLVRAKRSRENYRTLWTFLPEQVHMGLWPQTCTPYSANYTANEVAGTTGNDWSKAVLFCSIIPDGIHSNEYTGDAAKWYNSIHASATTPDVLALWCQDFPHWCESAGAAEFDLLSLYQNSFELEEVCGLNNVTH
jgi:hypothetical protein